MPDSHCTASCDEQTGGLTALPHLEQEFKECLGIAMCMQWLVLGFPIHKVISEINSAPSEYSQAVSLTMTDSFPDSECLLPSLLSKSIKAYY